MTPESLAALESPTLLVSLGTLQENPAASNVSPILDDLPAATLHETRAAWHFSFLAECSTLGSIVIGFLEEENICEDLFLRTRSDIHAELRTVIAGFLEGTLAP